MIALRLRQIALLLAAFAICAVAFYQMFYRVEGSFPSESAIALGVVCA